MDLGESVQKGSIQYPDKTAIIFGEQSWTYAQFAEIIDRLAASLIQLGIKIGDRADMILSQIRCTWYTVFFNAEYAEYCAKKRRVFGGCYITILSVSPSFP